MRDIHAIQPRLSFSQREELGHIDYLLAQLELLSWRGKLSDELRGEIEAEYRTRRESLECLGRTDAALALARNVELSRPNEALEWAEAVRAIDPTRSEAWWLAVEALERLGRLDDAIALAEEAAGVFEGFAPKTASLREVRERAEVQRQVGAWLTEARAATLAGDPSSAVALCDRVLSALPGHPEARALRARALSLVRPATTGSTGVRFLDESNEVGAKPTPWPAPDVEAGPSWASEFLRDHWQKLILCLAVLLILVSSTVGAHHLLGPLLWSWPGKCLLGLAYTVGFGGIGYGLVRWGAVRAGRIMLLTTLAVVPICFGLVGEMRLLTTPTPLEAATASLVALVLFGLCRAIVGALGWPDRTWFPALFLVLAAFNAGAFAGLPEWGMAGFVGMAVAYLGAVWSLGDRMDREAAQPSIEYASWSLGLMTYLFLFGAIRYGAYALRLDPPFYAVPLMLAAIAVVRTATKLPAIDPDPRHASLLQVVGLVAAGVAISLALSGPAASSEGFGVNAIATGALGFALVGTLLWTRRQPPFLYLAFGMLAVVRLGVEPFLDRTLFGRLLESLRHWLGYADALPLAFRAVNGLGLNVLLAILAIVFGRLWSDRRLAWHCHAIGLSLAIAACGLSLLEPKAALLVLPAYTVLFAIGAGLFAKPRLILLACASATGAAHVASTFVPGLSLSWQALGAAGLGLVFWSGGRLIGRFHANAYRETAFDATLGVLGLSLGVEFASLLLHGLTSIDAASFLAVGLIGVLVGLDRSRPALATASAACLVVSYLLAVLDAVPRLGLEAGVEASVLLLAIAVSAPLLCGIGVWLDRLSNRRGDGLASYVEPVFVLSIIMVALSSLLAGLTTLGLTEGGPVVRAAVVGATLGIGAIALAGVTAFRHRQAVLASGAVALLLGSFGAVALDVARTLGALRPVPWLGLGFGTSAMLLAMVGARLPSRRAAEPRPAVGVLYRWPCLVDALAAVAVAWSLDLVGWRDSPVVAASLAATVVALVVEAGVDVLAVLAYPALLAALGAWLSLTRVVLGDRLVLGPTLASAVALFAIGSLLLWEILRSREVPIGPQDTPRRRRRLAMVEAIPDASLLGFLGSAVMAAARWPIDGEVALALGLAAIAGLWLTRAKAEVVLFYLGLGLAVASPLATTVWLLPSHEIGRLLGWLGIVSAACGLAALLASVAFGRSRAAFYERPCRHVATILAPSAFALGLSSRIEDLSAFPHAIAALLLVASLAFGLAISWRSRWWTHGAILALVATSYVVLFSAGEPSTEGRPILGLLAVVEALIFWSLGQIGAKLLPESWRPILARPAEEASLGLAVLAVVPGYDSAVVLGLVAVAMLLMIRSYPSEHWFYPALAAAGGSLWHGFLVRLDAPALFWTLLIAAFMLWALAWAIRGNRSSWCRRIGVEDLGYEHPVFRSAVAVASVALALRCGRLVIDGGPWTGQLGASLGLSAFAIGMLAVYPGRVWIDLAIGLTTAGVASELSHWLEASAPLWALAGVLAAFGWRGISIAVGRFLVSRLEASEVVREWSIALLVISWIGLVVLVVGHAANSSGLVAAVPPGVRGEEWVAVLLGVLLAGAFADLEGRRPGTSGTWTIAPLLVTVPLAAWWLAVPPSTIPAIVGLERDEFLSVATATAALVLAIVSWLAGERRRVSAVALAATLAVLGPWLTRASIEPGTVATLAVSGLAFLLLALTTNGPFGHAAGALLSSSFPVAALVACPRWGLDGSADRTLIAATAGSIAGLVLLSLADLLRSRRADRVAGEFLLVAAMVLLVSATAAGLPPLQGKAVVDLAAGSGVVALLFCGFGFLWIASRLEAEWPVYLAQVCLVGGFLHQRAYHPRPFAGDALWLVLFLFLDLGIAELFARFRMGLFARPTLRSSLVMPLLLLGLALRHGQLDAANLFLTFGTAAFYAVAATRLRSRPLAYASGVLLNGALWVLWGSVGWRLADYPSLFLVPVGLSAILFAEVQRRELGRAYVNAIRLLGLVTVYTSLAVPIWQFSDLGSWLAMLLLSLTGVAVGIVLRVQVFFWMGMACFCLDVLYQLGRVGMEHAMAKWIIMLVLGLLMVLFVALNEKAHVARSLRLFLARARRWE